MPHEIKGVEVSDKGDPAIGEDTGLEFRRPPPSQWAAAGGSTGSAPVGGYCIRTALNSPTSVDQPPAQLEVFPEAEVILRPWPV